MIVLLALRNLLWRPWRSLLLFAGFGVGVGVMIVLLSIGEAMLLQARSERLVGGGEITVLPEGLDIELMKTGGLGGLFYSISNARFLNLQLFSSPRLAGSVAAVAPQIEGKLLYLRTPDGREVTVRATGEIPDATRAVGAAPVLAAGTWRDDSLDRRWIAPTRAELLNDIDHFHHTPADAAHPETWAEWHYFNVLSADRRRWWFLTLAVGGDVPRGEWGGQVLLSAQGDAQGDRRFTAAVPSQQVQLSTTRADLVLGASRVTLLPDGRYHVVASASDEAGGGGRATVDVVVTPAPRAYFPGVALGGEALVSGYAVPGLRADATGRICVDGRCEELREAQAYHDHNWGIWRRVDWEWGAARAGGFSFLYGRVQPTDSVADVTPLLLYLTDSLGFRALFRPRAVTYDDGRTILVNGARVRVPSRAVLADARGNDTLRVELEIEHATGTDTRLGFLARGDTTEARGIARPYFIQMKGVARLSGRVDGQPVSGVGTGFFETYR
ncbi:MAG TPA: hypothetical protein VHQ45_08160 [Gemmatimonadaceae bacterium]|nr:hypothetical protein [Gemmatimonadaceae bacterium]